MGFRQQTLDELRRINLFTFREIISGDSRDSIQENP